MSYVFAAETHTAVGIQIITYHIDIRDSHPTNDDIRRPAIQVLAQ